jgi:hypothetical protein
MSIWNWWVIAWLAVGDAILVAMFLAWDAKRFDLFARRCEGTLPSGAPIGRSQKKPAEAGQGRPRIREDGGRGSQDRQVPM